MNNILKYINNNKDIFLKFFISILICLSCIYSSGTHTQLNFFIFLLFIYFFYKRDLRLYLNGTFVADLVISVFFLSFSWIDFSSLNEYRARAFSLAYLYPSITIFILYINVFVYKECNYKFKDLLEKQTYLPFFSILLGIFSGISNSIHPNLGLLSSVHYFLIILFICFNCFLLKKYTTDGRKLMKIMPFMLYIFTFLLCKSKTSILLTLILVISYFLRIKYLEKIINFRYQKIYLLKITKIFSFVLVIILTVINLVSLDMASFSKGVRFIDQKIGNRILINNSIIKASKSLDKKQIEPQFIPNREYKVGKVLNELISNKKFIEKREKNLFNIYKKGDFNISKNKIMKDNPHNAYLYYLLLHTKIWNYILYFFIIIFSFSFLFKNQIYNFMNFYILFGTLTFETVPYLNSIFLTIISYLLVKLFCEFLSYQDFEPFKGIEYKFENKEFY